VIGYADQIASDCLSLLAQPLTIAGIAITAALRKRQPGALGRQLGDATSYISGSRSMMGVLIDGTVNQIVAIPGGQVVINEQQVLWTARWSWTRSRDRLWRVDAGVASARRAPAAGTDGGAGHDLLRADCNSGECVGRAGPWPPSAYLHDSLDFAR